MTTNDKIYIVTNYEEEILGIFLNYENVKKFAETYEDISEIYIDEQSIDDDNKEMYEYTMCADIQYELDTKEMFVEFMKVNNSVLNDFYTNNNDYSYKLDNNNECTGRIVLSRKVDTTDAKDIVEQYRPYIEKIIQLSKEAGLFKIQKNIELFDKICDTTWEEFK